MRLPDPCRGLVFNYAYSWSDQQAAGQTEGLKDRPCVVMGLGPPGPHQQVYVCPITHRRPEDGHAVEIPHSVKRQLGLDDKRSWINTSDVNGFDWKSSPDIRPVPGSHPVRYDYGMLSPGVMNAAMAKLEAAQQHHQVQIVQRSSDTQAAEYRSGRAAGSAERMRSLTAPLSPAEQRAWNEAHPEQDQSRSIDPGLTHGRRR